MKIKHTLTEHREIRNWVADRKGMPAIRRIPNHLGEVRARLALSFPQRHTTPKTPPVQDDGISPCSWSAWLAELDRQKLALKVVDGKQPAFEFIERRELN
ncbi:MAG TPA: hypothetical protein VGN80_17170 [Devosiaceae bacterium]|jgi:hypothetical protein|nr:hypothetical protein [Devosiaceae bacterium]